MNLLCNPLKRERAVIPLAHLSHALYLSSKHGSVIAHSRERNVKVRQRNADEVGKTAHKEHLVMVLSIMTNISYKRSKTDQFGTYVFDYRKTVSSNSPRVNGKLVLRSNTLDHRKTVSRRDSWGTCPAVTPIDSEINGTVSAADQAVLNGSLANSALQKFTSKVKKHKASLGVTLASWRQSRDMITSRAQKLAGVFGQAEREVAKMSRRQRDRLASRDRASDFLEVEFGFRPLAEDIIAAFDTLGRERPASSWVKASARAATSVSQMSDYPVSGFRTITNSQSALTVSMGGMVKVSNQNLWLANQLGLLNLPGVAWDIIPWSFVVNMVTNMGQMVNSMTDFVGLNISDFSTTKSAWIERTFSNYPSRNPSAAKYTGASNGYLRTVSKTRSLGGSVPSPSFQWRTPDLNMELAAIAFALIEQKTGAIGKLLKR